LKQTSETGSQLVFSGFFDNDGKQQGGSWWNWLVCYGNWCSIDTFGMIVIRNIFIVNRIRRFAQKRLP
jgi:hypothetical protein